MLASEEVFGNIVDPRLTGRIMSISPVFLVMNLLYWGWIWGWVGMVLSVPLAVMIVLVSAQIPGLRPVVVLAAPDLLDENED
jgi:AI-2 transport protein TqsA